MIPTDTLVMAKKKTPKLEKDWVSKPVAYQVRGCEEYKKAVEEVAESDGKSLASFVDHAVRFYIRSIGWTKPIPKR